MKAILIPFLSLLIPLTPQSAFAQSEPELKLESVVIVSRHGVRAPTKATQLMQDVTPDAWPTWPVKLGWLTPRGGELIAYLGHYQRQRLVADGLLAKKGCPQSGQVAIIADVDERTRKTGEAFAAGLAPDCAITVHTQADTSSPDPLFNPLKTGVCQLDNANVTDAILSRAGGSIADFTGHRQTAFRELERVLNFLFATTHARGCPQPRHPVIGFDHGSVDAPSTAKTGVWCDITHFSTVYCRTRY